MVNNIANRILSVISSKRFYRLILVFFVFEATWIALSAAYPQAFDEQYHFGLIKVYSHYLLPFLSKQPAGADQLGAVARNPSYLYHYLMSFPYRFIDIFTKRQAYQIIILRFIDIAMFTYGLTLFKKILIKTKLSEGLANVALLIFALIPIVPQLAGQVNYDDMLFPLVAVVCLLCFKMIDEIRKLKLSFKTSALMLIAATLTTLVKYAFLPIFLAIFCFFVFYAAVYYRHKVPRLIHSLALDFKKQPLILKVTLISLMVIAGGMFIERDVVNLVAYHSIDPDCAKVLSVNQCSAYSVWFYSYNQHQALVNQHITPSRNIVVYGVQWIYWMWYRLFFAVNGPTTQYTNYPPLPLPSAVALVVGFLGLIVTIRYRRELFKANPYATFLLMVCVFYVIALIVQGFKTYQFTAVLENMNGRYLIPVLLLAAAILAQAFSIALKKSERMKVIAAGVVVLLFLEGGGILTFINRSDNSWYWQNTSAIKANDVAKKITKNLVVGGKKTYTTSFWFFN